MTSKSMVELHGFGDASPKAYGAAVYIRVIESVGQVSSKLVMSKSRVAPIKEVSLPRLELLAAVVNTRLLKFVVDTLQIKMHRVVCWTDSMVTLHWKRRQSSCWNHLWQIEYQKYSRQGILSVGSTVLARTILQICWHVG